MENKILLQIKNLNTFFSTPEGVSKPVNGVNITINEGEIYSLVGESGSGKSVTALSIMQLLQKPAGYIESGEIIFKGKNLVDLSGSEMRKIRGKEISMIFQEPMTSLNPVFTVGEQIIEAIVLHEKLSQKEAFDKTVEILRSVGIPSPEKRINEYPHQMSGGMKQRIMIAMALACNPSLIIADEPTTALDVTIQAQILDLLRERCKKDRISILLVTHNLGIVRNFSDTVGVMYAGKIVETATVNELLKNPKHPYTKKLLESLPSRWARGKDLSIISGVVPAPTKYGEGCLFQPRCSYATEECGQSCPSLKNITDSHQAACFHSDEITPIQIEAISESSATALEQEQKMLIKIENVNVHFPIKAGLFKKLVGHVKAVDDFSLKIMQGKTTALVGESGCGKTTLGKAIIQLVPISAGKVYFEEECIISDQKVDIHTIRENIQMIFQDPYSSLNPRMRVSELIQEGAIAHKKPLSTDALVELVSKVGLTGEMLNRYPHEFSGGQRQRISIARALAVLPEIFICDEATSALDVSVQAQILNLLRKIQKEENLTYLFITHDLGVVEYLADYIAVMYLGRVVEEGPVLEVLDNPKHPYTKALFDAVPRLDSKGQKEVLRIQGDVPSPINPPSGCHFHPRCPFADEKCRQDYPPVVNATESHAYRCYRS
jgi:peptide/nickel transport system ATP-binding protein